MFDMFHLFYFFLVCHFWNAYWQYVGPHIKIQNTNTLHQQNCISPQSGHIAFNVIFMLLSFYCYTQMSLPFNRLWSLMWGYGSQVPMSVTSQRTWHSSSTFDTSGGHSATKPPSSLLIFWMRDYRIVINHWFPMSVDHKTTKPAAPLVPPKKPAPPPGKGRPGSLPPKRPDKPFTSSPNLK